MRDANLNVRADELLPLEREPSRAVVALALACWAVLLVLAGWSFHILWLHR